MHTRAVEAPNLLNQQICGMPVDSRKEVIGEPCPSTQLQGRGDKFNGWNEISQSA